MVDTGIIMCLSSRAYPSAKLNINIEFMYRRAKLCIFPGQCYADVLNATGMFKQISYFLCENYFRSIQEKPHTLHRLPPNEKRIENDTERSSSCPSSNNNIIIIQDLFYMDWSGSYIAWLKPELIEGLSMVGIVDI